MESWAANLWHENGLVMKRTTIEENDTNYIKENE